MNAEDVVKKRRVATTRMARSGLMLVVGVSAWAGILMSGMSRPWAMACAAVGGVLAMVVGMVAAGTVYHREMEALASRAGEDVDKVKLDLDKLRAEVVQQQRNFGVSAVAMAKTVADGVAAKIIARHTRNLPAPEHIEAAMRDAQAIVTEEIVAYGETLRKK